MANAFYGFLEMPTVGKGYRIAGLFPVDIG
jgi:hypothetical protein